MPCRMLPMVAVFLLASAGCLEAPADAAANEPPAKPIPLAPQPPAGHVPIAPETLNKTGEGEWHAIAPGIGCGAFCEPVVAVGLDGRLFVKGSTYARSTADGAFEAFDPPSVPLPGVGAFHTDRHLQVAPDGALWFHSLVGRYMETFMLLGVHVARSMDGGDTWSDAFLPLDGSLPTQSLGADRQWMAFASDGTAYVTFQQNAFITAFTPVTPIVQPNTANIWVARSDDDGATWTPFIPLDGVDPWSDQATGQPIVDQQNRLVVPFHRFSPPEALLEHGFAIAVADDGSPATQQQVRSVGTMFPALVQLPTGAFVAAHNGDGSLAWASASDLDGPWDFVPLGSEGAMLSSPWLGVRSDGTWDLVWMEGDGEGLFDVLHSINGSRPVVLASDLLGGPGIRSSTDFAHAGYLDDRLLIVTSDAHAGQVLLLLERPA